MEIYKILILLATFSTCTNDKKSHSSNDNLQAYDDPNSSQRIHLDNPNSYSNKEIQAKAENLGFDKSTKHKFNSHGELVFQKGNQFITRDNTFHNGGFWKKFNKKGRRLGTYSPKATTRIGD